MKKIVSFSFDDARLDSYRAITIALENGIKSTLNVTTAYVENKTDIKDYPCSLPAMSKDQVADLFSKKVEIACHGDKHNNSIDNILIGKTKLLSWLNLQPETPIGFASPHSKIDLCESNMLVLEKEFSYVRIGPFLGKVPLSHKIYRKIARLTALRWPFVKAYKKITNDPKKFVLSSIPIMRTNTFDQIKALLERHDEGDCWIVLMFHSVLDENEEGFNDSFNWPLSEYKKLCQYLKKSDVECLTTIEAKSQLLKVKES